MESTSQTYSGDLRGAHFTRASLTGARFAEVDLGDVVMRGVNLSGADLDDPFLTGGESTLTVNGVDVVPLIDAELNRRLPGRDQRHAADPEGLRSAWAAIEAAWADAIDRAAAMPDGAVDESVEGEWSFAQTLRHLVMATDMWLGRGILGREQPFHPLGMPNAEHEADGEDMSVFAPGTPPYTDVLEARADRVAMVRDFIGAATPAQLAQERRNPHDQRYPETVLSCLHTILEEEWEHLRFALRDLDAIDAAAAR